MGAATGFSPVASGCHLFQSASLLIRVFGFFSAQETSALVSPPGSPRNYCPAQHRTNDFAGFTGGLNKLLHALNGSIFLPGTKPKPHSLLWRNSFHLPNGMTVFKHAFYGKESLWLHATRKGSYFGIDTTRSDSKTLQGYVLRAVASGGEPGSRWPLLELYKHSSRPTAQRAQLRSTIFSQAERGQISSGSRELTPYRHLRYPHLRYQSIAVQGTASREHLAERLPTPRNSRGNSSRTALAGNAESKT